MPHLLKPTADGLEWVCDSRASSIFVGASRDNDAKFGRNIQAPCCVISGMLSHEYWGAEMGGDTVDGRFDENETQQRIDLFNDFEHHWFENSGPMLYYDEPGHSANVCLTFFTEKLSLT